MNSTANNSKLAVLGNPIAHSLSPKLHRTAFEVLGLDWEYQARQLSESEFQSFILTAEPSFLGFSVTAPLKFEAFKIAKNSDRYSQLTQASNTLVKVLSAEKSYWNAYNTDIPGLANSLSQLAATTSEPVLILGGGATARSVLVTLSELKSPKVALLLRAKSKADDLLALADQLKISLEILDFEDSAQYKTSEYRLVINTIPGTSDFGQIDQALDSFEGLAELYDVAYSPWPGFLAKKFFANSLRVFSGIDMLVEQAILQLRIFTTANATTELPNEQKVRAAMRDAISYNSYIA